jgi:hypothetical protein
MSGWNSVDIFLLEAEIHTKVFTMFDNITRAHKNSTEWKLAERQLHIKSLDSNSWFMEIKKLCIIILVRYKFSAVILMFQDLGHFRHAIQYP